MATTTPITTALAAQVLGVDASHVRRLLEAGTLQGVKAGRDWLVDRDDLYRQAAIPPSREGRPRSDWGGMDHEELAALFRRYGPAFMIREVREGVAGALREGWDLSRWIVTPGAGMAMLARVRWLPPALWSRPDRREYIGTAEPRLLWLNAREEDREQWRDVLATPVAPGDGPVIPLLLPMDGEYAEYSAEASLVHGERRRG